MLSLLPAYNRYDTNNKELTTPPPGHPHPATPRCRHHHTPHHATPLGQVIFTLVSTHISPSTHTLSASLPLGCRRQCAQSITGKKKNGCVVRPPSFIRLVLHSHSFASSSSTHSFAANSASACTIEIRVGITSSRLHSSQHLPCCRSGAGLFPKPNSR